MSWPLAAAIAARYLKSGRSHSAVTAISIASVAGLAAAVAATICVLSVFNGFRDLLCNTLYRLQSDVVVLPAAGKVIADADSLADALAMRPDVAAATPTITDNALALLDGREMPVAIRGVVGSAYRSVASLDSVLIAGDSRLTRPLEEGEVRYEYDPELDMYFETENIPYQYGVFSVGAASRLSAALGDRVLLFAPRRQGSVNLANPAASFLRDSVEVGGVMRTGRQELDERAIVVDLELARRLFQYSSEASAIEIKARGSDTKLAESLQRDLGEDYVVKDRMQQQEVNFRMVQIEKWVTFLLLSFILLIAGFNIISTLSMLVLDKQANLQTLRALGLRRSGIGAVFAWESLFVTLIGFAAGAAVGLLLCWLQQRYGLVRLNADPSAVVVEAYPVRIELMDLVWVFLPTAIIGALTALISARFAISRTTR